MDSKTRANTGLGEDIERLQQYLDGLAASSDDELTPYVLVHPRMPPGFYWQVRWLAGRMLRWLESMGLKEPDPWPAGLKQAPGSARAKPLLIWAVGTDRDMLRAACLRFADLQEAIPGFAPVLVTNVADFAFFSRVGCLVEYIPELTGEGERYEERKMRFLSRLYRGAPALPVSAVLESGSRPEEMRRWVMSRAGAAQGHRRSLAATFPPV